MDPLGTHRWPTAPGIDRHAVSTPCIMLVDDIHPLHTLYIISIMMSRIFAPFHHEYVDLDVVGLRLSVSVFRSRHIQWPCSML